MTNKRDMPLIIGISGGASSGKMEVSIKVKDALMEKSVGKNAIVLSLSSFYRDLSPDERAEAEQGNFDFDHPNAFNFKNLLDTLRKVVLRQKVTLPIYDCSAYSNSADSQEVLADVDVVIVEGILTFYQKEVRDMLGLKIFVESDADTRLCRKVFDDVSQKGRPLEAVLTNYFRFVKPAFEEFCLPTKKYADIILPRAPDNNVGIDLITEHLVQILSDQPTAPAHQHLGFGLPRARNQSESGARSIRPH